MTVFLYLYQYYQLCSLVQHWQCYFIPVSILSAMFPRPTLTVFFTSINTISYVPSSNIDSFSLYLYQYCQLCSLVQHWQFFLPLSILSAMFPRPTLTVFLYTSINTVSYVPSSNTDRFTLYLYQYYQLCSLVQHWQVFFIPLSILSAMFPHPTLTVLLYTSINTISYVPSSNTAISVPSSNTVVFVISVDALTFNLHHSCHLSQHAHLF